jgi:hypothetical protein
MAVLFAFPVCLREHLSASAKWGLIVGLFGIVLLTIHGGDDIEIQAVRGRVRWIESANGDTMPVRLLRHACRAGAILWTFVRYRLVWAVYRDVVRGHMVKLVQELSSTVRRTLVGTAVIIFVFRAVPGPGAGSAWWQIDVLGFDQQFLSRLSFIGSSLALCGMFIFRRFMAEKSLAHVVGFLTIVGTFLTLPTLGMHLACTSGHPP